MNRFAAEHPEDWEQRLDAMTDVWDMRDKTECSTCGGKGYVVYGIADGQFTVSGRAEYEPEACPDCQST